MPEPRPSVICSPAAPQPRSPDQLQHKPGTCCSRAPHNQKLESPVPGVPHPPLAAHRETLRVDRALYWLVDVAGQHVVAQQHMPCGLRATQHAPEADGLVPAGERMAGGRATSCKTRCDWQNGGESTALPSEPCTETHACSTCPAAPAAVLAGVQDAQLHVSPQVGQHSQGQGAHCHLRGRNTATHQLIAAQTSNQTFIVNLNPAQIK